MPGTEHIPDYVPAGWERADDLAIIRDELRMIAALPGCKAWVALRDLFERAHLELHGGDPDQLTVFEINFMTLIGLLLSFPDEQQFRLGLADLINQVDVLMQWEATRDIPAT
jgi:hypothetical protein